MLRWLIPLLLLPGIATSETISRAEAYVEFTSYAQSLGVGREPSETLFDNAETAVQCQVVFQRLQASYAEGSIERRFIRDFAVGSELRPDDAANIPTTVLYFDQLTTRLNGAPLGELRRLAPLCVYILRDQVAERMEERSHLLALDSPFGQAALDIGVAGFLALTEE